MWPHYLITPHLDPGRCRPPGELCLPIGAHKDRSGSCRLLGELCLPIGAHKDRSVDNLGRASMKNERGVN